MKKCKYFTEVSRDEWLEIQNMSDDEFLGKENIQGIYTKEVKNAANKEMKSDTFSPRGGE